MKKFAGLLLVGVLSLGVLTGCTTEPTITNTEKAYTEQLMKQVNDEIGMPDITEFYEKKMAKEIFELRDDSSLICYAYSYNEMTGKYVYIGKCMGFGLPYSTQYTNPEMLQKGGGSSVGYWATTIKQADPNGLYSGDGLSATWLQMIDEETGERYIWYCEPTIVVTQNKVPIRLIEEFSLEGIEY
ncbi:MAG: hypothetical protein ACRC1P_09415 [Cellulosilyticaceae bacterium]